MPTEPTRIYWDSCVYISCIEETPGRFPVLSSLIELAKKGEIVFVASAFVIAEVTKLDRPDLTSKEQAQRIRDFFENDYIKVRGVDRRTSEEAAEISRIYGLKPPDAVHVATAIRWRCASFQTYDGEKGGSTKLLAFNGKIGQPPLTIELPTAPQTQGTLFQSS
ncbi:MAG: PIN domain-containing protein [Planctomycetes bacterium]|nr:PIN domain-containing protein [Planctomycetota bacterium]